jgi:hypothetical protein
MNSGLRETATVLQNQAIEIKAILIYSLKRRRKRSDFKALALIFLKKKQSCLSSGSKPMKAQRRSRSEGKPIQASPKRKLQNIHGKKIDKITSINMQTTEFDGKVSIYKQDYCGNQPKAPEKLPLIQKARSKSQSSRFLTAILCLRLRVCIL